MALERPDAEELAAWLRLVTTPGVGRAAARRLLAAFASPQAVLAAPEAARQAVAGAAPAAALREPPEGFAQRLDALQRWLDESPAHQVLLLGDAAYPQRLLETVDPPLLLYLQGDERCLAADAVAVVGSRRPTPAGREHALQFAQALAAKGLAVVSGLAAGIDAAAHEGALRSGGPGRTVAVVGTGLDQVYPAMHRDLARRLLASGGLIASEYPLGAPPLAAHFPQRNRIIAGLTRGTLVVEAALRSGSLITARLAVEAGREVMVVPGSIAAEQAAGGHELIRQGATLVTSPEQVLESLGLLPPPAAEPLRRRRPPGPSTAGAARAPATDGGAAAAPARDPDSADPVLRAMGWEPAGLDALLARTGWPSPRLQAHLLALELAGEVARLPGGLYQRVQLS